ncbi:MAG: hypothetical protein EB060_08905, partial [Proteobacteria bacterium]|nr:hypothetical protein [Pseudomonadota bacterium]
MKKSTAFLAATLAVTVSTVAICSDAHADDPKKKSKKKHSSQTSSQSVQVNYGALDKYSGGKPASRDPQLLAEQDKARAAIGGGAAAPAPATISNAPSDKAADGAWKDPGSEDNVPVVIKSSGSSSYSSKGSRDPGVHALDESSFVTPDHPVKDEPLTGLERRRPANQPSTTPSQAPVIDMDAPNASSARAQQNRQYMDDFKRDMAAPPSDVVEQPSSLSNPEDTTVFQPVPEKVTKSSSSATSSKSTDTKKKSAKKKKKKSAKKHASSSKHTKSSTKSTKAKATEERKAPAAETAPTAPTAAPVAPAPAAPTPTQHENVNSVLDTLPPVAPVAAPVAPVAAPVEPSAQIPATAPVVPVAPIAPAEPAPAQPTLAPEPAPALAPAGEPAPAVAPTEPSVMAPAPAPTSDNA